MPCSLSLAGTSKYHIEKFASKSATPRMVAIGARFLAQVKDRTGKEPTASLVEHLGEQIRTLGCARRQIIMGPDLRLRDPVSLLFDAEWVSDPDGFDRWRWHVNLDRSDSFTTFGDKIGARLAHYSDAVAASGYTAEAPGWVRLEDVDKEDRLARSISTSELYHIVWGEEDMTISRSCGMPHDVVRLDGLVTVNQSDAYRAYKASRRSPLPAVPCPAVTCSEEQEGPTHT